MRILKLLLFFSLLGYQLHAQRVILKNKTGTETSKKPSPEYESRIAIKYNISSAAIGEFPLSVEFALRDNITVEAGIGLLHKNYMESIFFSPFTTLIASWKGYYDCETCDLSHSLNTSYFFKVRYSDDGSYFDGGYYALGLNYRPYIGTATISTINGLSTTDWSSAVFELSALKGHQLRINDAFFIDLYSGFGFQFKQMDAPISLYLNQDTPLTTIESQGLSIALRLGIAIGVFL